MKIIVSIALFLLFSFTDAPSANAKTAQQCCLDWRGSGNPSECYQLNNTENATCIADVFPPARYFSDPSSIINTLLPNIVLIAGIILFLLVIVAGFQMITSAGSGDANAVSKWRSLLMYGIIGFLIVLFAYTIIQLVGYFSGVDILNPEESLGP